LGNERWACECAEMLRGYEVYCYQVAYYLLGNESSALAASKAAMIHIALDEDFMELTDCERRDKVKRAVAIQSIQVKRASCTVLAG
jgi:hypothetical protein